MAGIKRCFIMWCYDGIEKQCIEKNLFVAGSRSGQLEKLKDVEPGDVGLLLNTDKDVLIGIFKAQSKVKRNLNANGWCKMYPIQVSVEPLGRIEWVENAKSVFRDIKISTKMVSKLRNPVPQSFVFSERNSEELLRYFRVGNYFLLLGLTPLANLEDLKKAYRRLAKRYHPDANVGASEEEMRFKKKAFQSLHEAYEQLITILE